MNYYIADCHFGHRGILNLDHRPFYDVRQMEDVMVMNWNAAVRNKDTVYILGDFCWGEADEWRRLLRRLNGEKVLIQGNHDFQSVPDELKQMFSDITPYKEIQDNGYRVILSHYPILFYNKDNTPSTYMLCGHVHATAENAFLEKFTAELKNTCMTTKSNGSTFAHCANIYNVGAMMPWMGYTPRSLDEIIRKRKLWEEQER